MKMPPIAPKPTRRRGPARLSPDEVGHHFREHSLRPGGPSGRVGVEVEFLAHMAQNPEGPVPFAALTGAVEAAGPMAGGGRVTFEPGGQLEVSSLPQAGAAAACAATERDLATLEPFLAAAGVVLSGVGFDPFRPPRRVVDAPRYRAMEAFFDADSDTGRRMMCSTAAVQVNVDPGPDPARTWRLAHTLGPVLAGSFANSPLTPAGPTGWCSSRLATWFFLDGTRTMPVGGADPAAAWERYALAARVMLVRRSERDFHPMLQPLSFAGWMADGWEDTWPTLDDLDYHLTTLFPPLRPRGFLELRMVDALPEPWWRVPVAVAAVLLDDQEAGMVAAAAATPAAGLWATAAREGLAHPVIGEAAQRCFAVALEVLEDDADGRRLAPVVAGYRDRFVARGRCPADDLLAAWQRNGTRISLDEFACTT